jgi:DNA-binding MltR family transcriptional regulator
MGKKRSLSTLTRTRLSSRDFGYAIAAPIQAQDDRTAAIIAASAVDVALEAAIRTKFRNLSREEIDSLFAGTGPLSTASGKISVGYALGIFGSQTKHDLKTIKDVRNVFAHRPQNTTFKIKPIKDRIFGLHISNRNHDDQFVRDPRQFYLEACRIYTLLLHLTGASRKRVRISRVRKSDLDH